MFVGWGLFMFFPLQSFSWGHQDMEAEFLFIFLSNAMLIPLKKSLIAKNRKINKGSNTVKWFLWNSTWNFVLYLCEISMTAHFPCKDHCELIWHNSAFQEPRSCSICSTNRTSSINWWLYLRAYQKVKSWHEYDRERPLIASYR